MNLNNGPFNRVKNGTKTIELRLNDEKRQLLKENDLIWKNIILKKNKINMELLG